MTAGYKLVKTIPLGAPDRWDYVVFDPPSHRVYVAHGDRVTVVDGHDGHLIGNVMGISGGTHGIAVSPETGKGYTDDGKAGVAVAFDLKTLAVKATIPVQTDADAVVFERTSGHVFIIEGDPAKVSVIDPKTDTVVATIDGGGKMEYAATDDAGALYVAGEEKRDVVRIDTHTNAVTAHWPIPDCASPHGLALDAKGHRVFVSCVNEKLVSVDTVTGKETASGPIGKGTDAAAFDPKRKLVFSSNGIDGDLSIIHEGPSGALTAGPVLQTSVSGRTMAVDPETGRIYIAAADTDPNPTPGGRARSRPGSLKLLVFDPVGAPR
jgi:DNA-binding beta-propeller fold protein YncE